jgi:hypothetical protein
VRDRPLEADWAVEIGADLPVIVALWADFVDLAAAPDRAFELQETKQFSALADALLQINCSGGSDTSVNQLGFWTAKCDLWEPEEWDAFEMNANADQANAAIACYIDILPRGPAGAPHALFRKWQQAEQCAHRLVMKMRRRELACSRIDCVVRSAQAAEAEGFGITTYLTACGRDKTAAASALASALQIFTEALAGIPAQDSTENLLPLQ